MSTHAFANPFRPYNPFLPSRDDEPGLEVADAREASYALVASGPAIAAEEVESHLDATEVTVRWGAQVLSVTHLDAGKGFSIGEGGDFVVPELVRAPLVEARRDGAVAVIPEGARGVARARGEAPRAVTAGDEIALTQGTIVTIELAARTASDLTVEIASVRAGKRLPVGFFTALASGAAASIALSFVGHAAIVASLAMFMPSMNADDAEAISREQVLTMQAMLNASAEREQERIEEQREAGPAAEAGGGSKGGEPHMGDSGAAGTTKPVTTRGHMAFRGSDDRVQLSRKEELALAAEGGLVGILLAGAPERGHTSPWGTTQLGMDAENKLGAMFGADANDMMGWGLGLYGTGEGGGGKGHGIGLDGIGDLVGGGGNGPGKWGIGRGDKDGIGNGHAPVGGGHVAKAPVMRTPSFDSNGRLPAEVIQRTVRQNFGRFRLCYEAALRTNPGLTGRVTTKFVIGRDGAVAQASDGGSDLASQQAIGCVVRSFTNLSFPPPEGGIATVTYPIVFSPGE